MQLRVNDKVLYKCYTLGGREGEIGGQAKQ